MLLPARTIWDVKVQCVSSVVSARNGDDVELWLCGNFGQASVAGPHIAVNPNRLYPIEPAIRREGRFAIGVFSAGQRDAAIRLSRIRRRTPRKAAVLGFPLLEDDRWRIPYIGGCARTLFCEVEQALDTGDHTLIVARVLEHRVDPQQAAAMPLLYQEISGSPSAYPGLSRALRTVVTVTGVKDRLQSYLRRRRGAESGTLPENTYRDGGQTDPAIEQTLRYGAVDEGRAILPPGPASRVLSRKLGVCVVGAGEWGSYHCRLFRQASPMVDLYVCARSATRAERVARAVGASGVIVGLEAAIADPRVEALSLALPHSLHAEAARLAVQAGKHVLVEKPIATTLADADAMIDAARRAGVILMVAEDMHFRPAVREAALAIARGDIGEPLYFQVHAGGSRSPSGWQADPVAAGGGVLMDIGVHYVRALRLIMGEPQRVFASRSMQINTKISVEDSVQLLFSSGYGWQSHMLLNWASPRGDCPDIIVAGEHGALHLWPGKPYFDFYPAAPTPILQLLSYVRPVWLQEKLMRPGLGRVRRKIPDADLHGYSTEVKEFLAAVAEGREPAGSPEDARRDLEIVLSGYQALNEERWVEIPR